MTESVVKKSAPPVTIVGLDDAGNRQEGGMVGRAAKVHESGLGAGERNVDDATDGYQVIREECNLTVIDILILWASW